MASGFVLRAGYAHPVVSAGARDGAIRAASVELPMNACDPVRLEDDMTHVAVTFSLRGASHTELTVAAGMALYQGALDGADVLHRVHAEGTEDYVVFEQRPAREEIAYDVDVSHAAGLRLVSNTLEFLDAAGTPRLRISPPYVVDAKGGRGEGALALEGCMADVSPRAPWGRPVTSPGSSHCTVLVSWCAAVYPAMVDPIWGATGSMATVRTLHTATLLASGDVLVAGGEGMAMSYTTPILSSAELYNPKKGTFAATSSMTTKRSRDTATLLGSGRVLVAGGSTLPSAELYDPKAGTFTATGPMMTDRTDHSATLLASGDVLIAGGTGSGGYLSSAELYRPAGGTFGATGSMTTPRFWHTAALLQSGDVLVAGGRSLVGVPTSSAELYDPTGGTFTATVGAMTTARASQTATVLASGAVLIAGGYDESTTLSSAEFYDPTSESFTGAAAAMTTPRYSHTATLLGSGDVLIAGGFGTATVASSAEVYDSIAGLFAATASMMKARTEHTATLLGSGQVLVAGGSMDEAGDLTSSAEVYCTGPLVTACPSGDSCGTISNGCGGSVSCGVCGSGETCTEKKCVRERKDAGAESDASSKDSGTGAKDSGMVAKDSGTGRDAANDAASGGGNPSAGCGCRTAQRGELPSYPLVGFGGLALIGFARSRRSVVPWDPSSAARRRRPDRVRLVAWANGRQPGSTA
jgi:hypothetical protein